MTVSYTKELLIAQIVVQQASIVIKNLFQSIERGIKFKADQTLVTIADFAVQALLIGAVHYYFPFDEIVGEESADLLRQDPLLLSHVWEIVSSANSDTIEGQELLYTPKSAEEMCDIIDLGSGAGGREGRVWVLDPIDGTAAFVRGQQYAVCLALLEDGYEKVGVLGCPNLSLDKGKVSEELIDRDGYGLMLSAVRGQGSFHSANLERASATSESD